MRWYKNFGAQNLLFSARLLLGGCSVHFSYEEYLILVLHNDFLKLSVCGHFGDTGFRVDSDSHTVVYQSRTYINHCSLSITPHPRLTLYSIGPQRPNLEWSY